MLEITCSGSPYNIGLQHGQGSWDKIKKGLQFYADFFKAKTGMSWADATSAAEAFIPYLERDWPDFIEEMRGVADGARVPFQSILAMNARTEISMGMMNDGCTSMSWKTSDASFLAQNWDWEPEQEKNLVVLHIKRNSKPSIIQITEAGIIGKIGFNSFGVGVCLNAIRIRGVNYNQLPGHLALRAVLDCHSRHEALQTIEKSRVAAAIHILVADRSGSTSIEASSLDVIFTEMIDGKVAHANHFIHEHDSNVPKTPIASDSIVRQARILELMGNVHRPTLDSLEHILQDEFNAPFGINKAGSQQEPLRTLFAIVMHLDSNSAILKCGRPTNPSHILRLHI